MDYSDGFGALGAMMGILIFVYIVILVLVVIGLWKIFEKAGKPGWAAIVPFYNVYILLEIVGRPTWWIFVFIGSLIPFVNIFAGIATFVMFIILCLDLAKSFGKSTGFAVGMILLSFVFFPLLGFSDAQYQGPSVQQPNQNQM